MSNNWEFRVVVSTIFFLVQIIIGAASEKCRDIYLFLKNNVGEMIFVNWWLRVSKI